ncbi:MAG: type III ribulose-bisphosphate carboxylase [Candidatus Bathyarchaeia archaeon]
MRYIDFVDESYKPSKDDLICEFYVETQGIPLEEGMGGVAAESSIGTWTELTTVKPYVESLHATVYDINGNNCKIAYPSGLFERGNMPNILSSIAGNVFGLDDLRRLRLNDVKFPEWLEKSFQGPRYGIQGVRGLLDVEDRPLVGTIVKPKLGLRTEDHAQVAYEAWSGGCDIVKDDENLASQDFNRFEDRVIETLEARDRAEEETGESKVYMVNVTSMAEEMVDRAEFVEDSGGRYMMVDIITCGWSALQYLREQELELVIHAHRAGHAAFTRLDTHGISMVVLAKIARLIGVDQLHIGTAVGKMSEEKEEVLSNVTAITQPLFGMKRVFPVASGGLHPGLVPDLVDIFSRDIIIQAGGGIHGHPDGSVSGAMAMRQALDAKLEGIDPEDYAESHKELQRALETWSKV